jgi:multiple sugar transport system permease protein
MGYDLKRGKASEAERRYGRTCVLLLLPALVLIGVTLVYPLAFAGYISLRDWNLYQGRNEFVGLANYREILQDWEFGAAILRTFLYMAIVVSANVVLSLAFALIANTQFRGFRLFIGIMMLPMFLIPAAGATLWRVMYLREFGLINHLLNFFGLERVAWLASGATAIYAVMVADIWSWTPFMFLVVYAGLRAVPEEPIESAKLDGATYFQVFRHIILPLLSPVLAIAVTLKSINVFRTFDYVQVMTSGGPGGESHVAATYIFEKAMASLNYGYGTSMSMVMLLISAIMSIGFIHLVRRTEGRI